MIYFFLFLGIYLLSAKPALAVCPVCTVAVGSALGISRILGIDDLVSSFWIGALLLSSSLWLSDYLEKKDKLKKYSNPYIISFIFYTLVLIPFWYSGVIGVPYNTFLGIDKVFLGIVIGTITFLLSVHLDKKVRKMRGKQFFSYQKVVFPLAALVLISTVFHFLI